MYEEKLCGSITNCISSAVAIDLSPAQNALLELKLAAIARLPSYHDFVVLLGEVEEDSTSKRFSI